MLRGRIALEMVVHNPIEKGAPGRMFFWETSLAE
jgi:hypothetical protein